MLSGCVSYETYECRIFTEERDYPLYRIEEEFGNLSADDESNSADDLFRDLLTYIEGEEIALEAQEDAVILLLNGQPIDEPIAAYGPFVMNTQPEIRRAIEDYESGRMGKIV